MPHEPTKEQIHKTLSYLTRELRDQIFDISQQYMEDMYQTELLKKLWNNTWGKEISLEIGCEHPVITYLLECRLRNNDLEYMDLLDNLVSYRCDSGRTPDDYDTDYQCGKLFVIGNTLNYLGYDYLGHVAVQWAIARI